MKKMHLLLLAVCCTCLSISATAQLPSYVPTNGLKAWWGFTGNPNDYSGTGNHGTIIGNVIPTADRFGTPNAAYSFDSSYISLASCPTTGTGDFTLSVWFQTAGTSGGIFNYGTATNSNRIFFDMNNSKLHFGLSMSSGPLTIGTVNDGVWHLGTGTNRNNVLTIYLDGLAVDSMLKNPNIIAGPYNHIGMKVWGSVYVYFTGKIDDVGVWNRALSQAEITGLYSGVPVSVAETASSNMIKISPNPASNMLDIAFEKPFDGCIELLNINGQLVLERAVTETQSVSLDVSCFPNGIYLLKVKGKNGVTVNKVVVQH